MAPPDDGGTYAAIDPALLKAMIKDLGDVRDLVRNRVPGLKYDFQKVGLSTKPIDTLVGVAGWVDGELPALNRRQAMAEQLSKQNNEFGFSGAMVETEWTGLFKNKAEAEAKAKEIAAKYKYGLPDDAWDEIAKYADDPDFAEALARELGPEKVAVLTGLLRSDFNSGHNKDQAEARLRALGTAMANASQRGVIDDTWLAQINYKNDQGPSLYDFGALFKYGTWNKDTLVNVGQKALHSDQAAGGSYATAAILDGIARNPLAANELYTKEFDRIQGLVSGNAFQWYGAHNDPKLGDPLGRFIYSATAEAHDVYARMTVFGTHTGDNPADVLTRRMLLDIDKHKDNPTPWSGVQAAYAGIAKFYYDDIKASVTSPLPSYFDDNDPNRPGVEASSQAWSNLVQQSMADPKNAADLNLFFAAKYKEESDRIAAGEFPDSKDANSFTNYQNGQIKGWFLQNFEAAKKRAGDAVDAYNKEVDHWVGLFVDAAVAAGTAEAAPAVGVARGAAAGGALVNSTKDFVKGLGVDGAKSYIADIFHKDPPKYDVDVSWAEDTKVWVDKAGSLHNAGKIPPVTEPGGVTWTGDTKLYEDLYHGKFTENGQIMPIDKMDANGKLAYQHWLQDPAVQQATWNEFQSDTYGKSHTPN
ncbi:hypothetical protein J5X84_19705 [Streptosporangiaceae bacterium NEAU-GS5]|nr:hypothetical protein [Streptosporangiaceae bacterium NEAU-GS5]